MKLVIKNKVEKNREEFGLLLVKNFLDKIKNVPSIDILDSDEKNFLEYTQEPFTIEKFLDKLSHYNFDRLYLNDYTLNLNPSDIIKLNSGNNVLFENRMKEMIKLSKKDKLNDYFVKSFKIKDDLIIPVWKFAKVAFIFDLRKNLLEYDILED